VATKYIRIFEIGPGSWIRLKATAGSDTTLLEEGEAGRAEHTSELGRGIGRAHIDDPHRLDPGPWRLNAEQARGLAALDAAPELLLRGQQEVLV
jgi:hypothetical protein